MKKPNLICTKKAARILSISPRTMENYRQSGIGPPYMKLGKIVRYCPTELEEWISSQKYAT